MKLRVHSLTLAVAAMAAAASADDSQTTEGLEWAAVDAPNCAQASPDSGGNPGGYLDLSCGVDTRTLALASRAPAAGLAGQRWTVSFDLLQLDSASLGTV